MTSRPIAEARLIRFSPDSDRGRADTSQKCQGRHKAKPLRSKTSDQVMRLDWPLHPEALAFDTALGMQAVGV